jgi:hypothetical protein
MGPGQLWIDEVQLCDLDFSEMERTALWKLIAPADPMLGNRQVRDCIHLLEGYWPRFLAANVPLVPAVSRKPKSPPQPPPKEPEDSPSLLERLKDFVPKKLRFF